MFSVNFIIVHLRRLMSFAADLLPSRGKSCRIILHFHTEWKVYIQNGIQKKNLHHCHLPSFSSTHSLVFDGNASILMSISSDSKFFNSFDVSLASENFAQTWLCKRKTRGRCLLFFILFLVINREVMWQIHTHPPTFRFREHLKSNALQLI